MKVPDLRERRGFFNEIKELLRHFARMGEVDRMIAEVLIESEFDFNLLDQDVLVFVMLKDLNRGQIGILNGLVTQVGFGDVFAVNGVVINRHSERLNWS